MEPSEALERYVARDTVFAEGLFKDKTVLIFGGSSGIGLASAWLLARLGAQVVIAARNEGRLSTVVNSMEKAGFDRVSYVVSNVRDLDSIKEVFAKDFYKNSLHTVVNCAGGQFPQAAIDFNQKGWAAVVDTNLNGSWNLMSTAANFWKQNRLKGNFVNLVVVNQGVYGVAHTSAARAGVIAFSEKASVEWAPLGIRINCVAPGVIRTEGWDVYSEEVQSCYSKTNPLMRSGDAWEVAEAIVFLSSPAASFINGETLVIDGGGRHWGEIWTTGKPEYFQAASRVWDDKKSEE